MECTPWIYHLEAGLLTVKAGGILEDALKKFFDELLKQRLFIEDIMGIFDNSGYLNLLFGQSKNYENGITDFEIKSRDENGSDINNERLQRNTGYIQYINNYNILNRENFKNENISYLKEAENIINVFDSRSVFNESIGILEDGLRETYVYPRYKVYNNYFTGETIENNLTDIFNNKNYSSTVVSGGDIFNEVWSNNYNAVTEKTEEELLQSVIKQSDKKYYVNTKLNGGREYLTLNNGKKTETNKWVEDAIEPNESGKVNITLNNYSNIYNQADEESIIDSIAKKIIEYAQSGAEGVHI